MLRGKFLSWWQISFCRGDVSSRDTKLAIAALLGAALLWARNASAGIVMNPASKNLRAFLYAIRRSEHLASDVASGMDYWTFYGGSRFLSSHDHPALTGEKSGVRLPDQMCINAGFAPGCVSTAAGAYQINVPTWREFRRAGGWGPELTDFSPESQDEAARRIIARENALSAVEAGDWETALQLVGNRWASLPTSTSGQGGRTFAQFAEYLYTALGMLDGGIDVDIA